MGKNIFRICFLITFCLMLTLSASGQGSLNVQVHTTKAVPFTETIGYTVDVYVSALDADGTPLKDLGINSFKLFEDSELKEIKSVTPIENESMSLVLLMDTSGSMAGYVGPVQGYDGFIGDASLAASRFLERLGRNDRSAVMTFNDEISTLQQFTSDHYNSSEAAKQATPKFQGGTCLYDAIYAAMEMTLSEPEGRRAVVAFTDGKDETITGEKCSTKLVSDVMDFSLANRIPIYTLGFGPKTDDKDLKRMGESSGGSFIKAETKADLDSAFNKLYEQLNNEYKLTYESIQAAGPHTLLVEANKEQAFGRDSYNMTLPVMPTIMHFESPKENEQLKGEVLLAVNFISQSSEISAVEFSCNGRVVGRSVSRPYEFVWDVSSYMPQDGLILEAVAFDKSGAEMARISLPVSIVETPEEVKAEVSFTSPHQGEEHQESVKISSSVTSVKDEVGNVEYYGNGQYLGKVVSPPYAFTWDISKLPSGNVNIDAIVYSKDNRELARNSVMIYVKEMPTPTPEPTQSLETPESMKPQVEFTEPNEGQEYQGIINIGASVQTYGDEVGNIEYFGNGQYLGKVVSPPYSFTWDVSGLPSGNVKIEAIVYSKEARELARKSVMIYVKALPTATPEPTGPVETPEHLKPRIEFTSLEDGSEHQGSVTLSVSEYNIEDIGSVDYYGNGKYLGKAVSAPFSYDWDISQMNSGSVDVLAIAFSKDSREIARTTKKIYILAVPTPTPTNTSVPTETPYYTPTPDPKVTVVEQQNKILMYGLAGLGVIVIIILIIIAATRKKKDDSVTPPLPPLPPLPPTPPIPSDDKSEFGTLTIQESNDKAMIGAVINIDRLPLSIGRSPDNDIIFTQADSSVSRHHASLDIQNGQITIKDEGSTYHTYVNEEQIGDDPVILRNNDTIRLGKIVKLSFSRSLWNNLGGDTPTTETPLPSDVTSDANVFPGNWSN